MECSVAPRKLLVWHAGVSWTSVAGTDRHMATLLSRYADILWVDPPISLITPSRFIGDRSRHPWPVLQELNPGMIRLTPKATPFHSRAPIRWITWGLVRGQARWALRKIGRQPHAVIASNFDAVMHGYERHVTRVLYGTDDFVAGAALMGLEPDRIAQEERDCLNRADVAIVVSEELAQRWRLLGFEGPIGVVPNGVNCAAYRECSSRRGTAVDVDLPRPIVGLIGQLSSRIDIELLFSISRRPCSLLLVGPLDPNWETLRFAELVSRPNVRWVGPVPFEELPGYLESVDVGITPYADTAFNRASFPLKTLEYLAAGKPVVSTDLPAVRWLATDLVKVAGPAEFGEVVQSISAEAQTLEVVERRQAFAERHSWTARAAQFAKLIGLAEPEDG